MRRCRSAAIFILYRQLSRSDRPSYSRGRESAAQLKNPLRSARFYPPPPIHAAHEGCATIGAGPAAWRFDTPVARCFHGPAPLSGRPPVAGRRDLFHREPHCQHGAAVCANARADQPTIRRAAIRKRSENSGPLFPNLQPPPSLATVWPVRNRPVDSKRWTQYPPSRHSVDKRGYPIFCFGLISNFGV